jgi:PAS domain S-box-containing protein
VRKLVEAARRVAGGDLGARTGLPREYGEFGELARAFDEMVETLEARHAQPSAAEGGRSSVERALAASEERLRQLVEGVQDYAIYLLDPDGHVASWNAGAERITGYREAEVIGAHISMFFLPGDVQSDQPARLLQVAATQGRAEDESWFARKDGTMYRAHAAITPIAGADGRLAGFATVTHDITERARAEAEVRQRGRELAVLNAVIAAASSSLELSDAVAALRETLIGELHAAWGRIFVCDEAGTTLSLEAIWGTDGSEEESLAATAEYRLRATDRGTPVIVQNYACVPLMARDQVEGLLEISIHGPAEARQDDAFFVALGRQIGGALYNMRLHRQVRTSGERLERLSRRLLEIQETERRSLARELHDEIGQALTSVKINLQSLRRGAKTAAPRVDDSIKIVSRLLQQVRDISLDLRPSLLDDWGLLPALRWYVERLAQRAGIAARVVADGEERFAPDVETACFRIVQEALTNAVRHARARNVIVELRRTATELEAVVRDDGTGFQVRVARHKASRGTSVGLLGMEERARLLGGTLVITSALKEGTEVRARFPLRRGDDARRT